jgi:hypothetical protein
LGFLTTQESNHPLCDFGAFHMDHHALAVDVADFQVRQFGRPESSGQAHCGSFSSLVLRKSWSIVDTPYPKRNFRLPKVLSQQQVAKLIDSATTPFYRITDRHAPARADPEVA